MSTIENWTLISMNANEGYQITGQVYGDNRAVDGSPIRTSTLKSIDFKNGRAQTRNTLYSLGEHANGTVQLGKTLEDQAIKTNF